MKQETRRKIKEIVLWLVAFVGVFGGYYMMDTQVIGRAEVDGTSMVPTYHDQDRTVFSRLKEPEHGDIVIFMMRDIPIIKRVIAIEGDTIEIRNGVVYLNGSALDEPYITEYWTNGGCIDDKPLTLKKGEYFLMGDNRNVSHDSRAEGVFTKEDYVGTVMMNLKLSPESTIKSQMK